MPWKECHAVEERLRFIARLLDGEKMAGLCREFGISRKTGYKIYTRYKDCGIDGLTDRSRRPYRQANQLPMQIEKLIVGLKKGYPHWGAPKIREKLRRLYPEMTSCCHDRARLSGSSITRRCPLRTSGRSCGKFAKTPALPHGPSSSPF